VFDTTTHTSGGGHLSYEKCLLASVSEFWALLTDHFENQFNLIQNIERKLIEKILFFSFKGSHFQNF